MRSTRFTLQALGPILVAGALSACGGGSGGGDAVTNPGGGQNNPPPVGGGGQDPVASMTMQCVGGASQCSGGTAVITEGTDGLSVTLSESGVQVFGKSTVGPVGMEPTSGGFAEIRIDRDSSDAVSNPVMLLRNLGLKWDGVTERPPIIETFQTRQSRVVLNANGTIDVRALPPRNDLTFYDYAVKGAAGTQAHYANNHYFPRQDPSRCPADMPTCPTEETMPFQFQRGDWQSGGLNPDVASAGRLHGDGDVHAGDSDGSNGSTTLPDGNGPGVPFPGSKGYRRLDNFSLRYGNLGIWETEDTVQIHQWGATDEHVQSRRGLVAFGDVTRPADVPSSGFANYSGVAYGWYVSKATEAVSFFRADAVVEANFALGQVTVTVRNARTNDAAATVVPVSFTSVTKTGDRNRNLSNYMSGTVDAGSMQGRIGGRYFGPGPAEIGGTFVLRNDAGASVVAGFIARK